MSLTLTDRNYDQYTQQNKLTVVDFWAEWCGPCRAMGPIIEELAEKFGDKANIGKCNVDTNGNFALECGITSIPTLVFFREGREIARLVGVKPKQQLEELIQSRL